MLPMAARHFPRAERARPASLVASPDGHWTIRAGNAARGCESWRHRPRGAAGRVGRASGAVLPAVQQARFHIRILPTRY